MAESKNEIVVTGVNGFVGEHLAHHLHDADFLVRGVGRESVAGDNVAPYLDSYQSADLLDENATKQLILKDAKAIIHLAGLASVADSFNNPELYKVGNASMTENLLKAANEQGFDGRVVAISTGALYDASQQMPLTELSDTIESSPYAIGKLRAEEVIKRYREDGLDAVIARPFNHIGPGQGKGFLVGDLYDELKRAEAGGVSEISVGNLGTKRDYTDVRDIVKAYTLLAVAETLDDEVYNIASGKPLSGFDILEYLKSDMGLDYIQPVVDPSRIRPTDAAIIIGDASRIGSELGWAVESSVDQAIKDFVARKITSA
jgi:GDP-4-dehydro-6-deoxy-D-mannose reductase